MKHFKYIIVRNDCQFAFLIDDSMCDYIVDAESNEKHNSSIEMVINTLNFYRKNRTRVLPIDWKCYKCNSDTFYIIQEKFNDYLQDPKTSVLR